MIVMGAKTQIYYKLLGSFSKIEKTLGLFFILCFHSVYSQIYISDHAVLYIGDLALVSASRDSAQIKTENPVKIYASAKSLIINQSAEIKVIAWSSKKSLERKRTTPIASQDNQKLKHLQKNKNLSTEIKHHYDRQKDLASSYFSRTLNHNNTLADNQRLNNLYSVVAQTGYPSILFSNNKPQKTFTSPDKILKEKPSLLFAGRAPPHLV